MLFFFLIIFLIFKTGFSYLSFYTFSLAFCFTFYIALLVFVCLKKLEKDGGEEEVLLRVAMWCKDVFVETRRRRRKERSHKNNREPWKMGKLIFRGPTIRGRFILELPSFILWYSPFQAPFLGRFPFGELDEDIEGEDVIKKQHKDGRRNCQRFGNWFMTCDPFKF